MSLLRYGSFPFEANEANLVAMERAPLVSPRGFRLIDVDRMRINVVVKKDTPDALTTRINAINSAFAVNYQDAILYTDDGGTIISSHTLYNSSSLTGVRVLHGPAWDESDGAEYAVKRTCSIVLEAQYDASDSDLVAWQDSIQFIGTGGPDYAVLPTFSGPAVFPLGSATPQVIVRRGRAVGFVTWVSPPGIGGLGLTGTYYLPAMLQREELGSARMLGNAYRFFPSSWDYTVYCFTPQIVLPQSR